MENQRKGSLGSRKDLSSLGIQRISWAESRMPVLRRIRETWGTEKPLSGLRIGACLHVTTETAALMLTLKEGGASVTLCASNPLSTQDDVACALNEELGIPTFARRGEPEDEYFANIARVAETRPHVIMDDGGDLTTFVHTQAPPAALGNILGGTEETTTGVIRLRAMVRESRLSFPVIAVNDAKTKSMFDNRYGTGQSSLDGIIRATNKLLAGACVVVAGYGWCGKGVAQRARGLGARVIVTEADPVRALEAVMDGFEVLTMKKAAPLGEIFVTVTGNINVITKEHFPLLKDGAILANAGHFDVEVDVRSLDETALSRREVRPNVTEYVFPWGKKAYLVAEGRLVNLGAAEGHPAEVMDMSFANQALSVEYLVKERPAKPGVYPVPEEIDRQVARLKLESMGYETEELTDEQRRYLQSWKP